jgi:hypothetical protein
MRFSVLNYKGDETEMLRKLKEKIEILGNTPVPYQISAIFRKK